MSVDRVNVKRLLRRARREENVMIQAGREDGEPFLVIVVSGCNVGLLKQLGSNAIVALRRLSLKTMTFEEEV